MKIGILTFHHAHNYGAVLQAYALKTFLQRLGHDVQIIDYHNSTIASAYPKAIPIPYRLRDFLHLRHLPKMISAMRDVFAAQSHWKIQWQRFESFIRDVLLDKESVPVSAENVVTLQLDAFVAGSDQIWNDGLTGGLDRVFLLDWDTPGKKIFYGASNGKSVIPEDQTEIFCKALSRSNAISTREQALAEYIQRTFHLATNHVVDPTLLLDCNDYEILTSSSQKHSLEESFVFAYFIVEDEKLMKIAQYISRVKNLRLIELHYYKKANLPGDNQRADFGPQEFLYHIRHAAYVVTNSFHGTVFSVIFQKEFYSVYDTDSRKDGLLSNLGISRRHVQSPAQIDLNDRIDYPSIEKKLEEMKKESSDFLRKALGQ